MAREGEVAQRTDEPRRRGVEQPTEGKTPNVAGREGSVGRGGQADGPRNPKTEGADEPRKAVQGERGIESEMTQASVTMWWISVCPPSTLMSMYLSHGARHSRPNRVTGVGTQQGGGHTTEVVN